MNQENSIQKRIADDVSKHPILIYVKGSPKMPQCGFSKAVMDIFDSLNVPYETRDVLSDPQIREGIKHFTQWPTIPQLFINGEFIGGCDIVRELYQNGELQELVKKAAK